MSLLSKYRIGDYLRAVLKVRIGGMNQSVEVHCKVADIYLDGDMLLEILAPEPYCVTAFASEEAIMIGLSMVEEIELIPEEEYLKWAAIVNISR